VPPLGRLVFLGTGQFGVPLLSRLPAMCDELLVISQPDRPAGRGLQDRPSPVTAWARANGVEARAPRRLRSEDGRAIVRDFAPDGLLLAAYGQLLPDDVLAVAARPPLNVHPSLLPRHRGAAPVASTILAGEPMAGLSLMVMTSELDAGPLVAQWPMPLTGRETTPELEADLARLAAQVVPPELERWAAAELVSRPQDARAATFSRPFRRSDGWIDWSEDAAAIDRRVRALQPWPGAWTTFDDRRLHIRAAHPVASVDGPTGALLPGRQPVVACGRGALALELVQPAGRPVMPADAWRRGLPAGDFQLGDGPPPA
jgi:methionyl-tRNA formyltransferase